MKKYISFVIVAIFTSISSMAQRVNVPNNGENIIFYPVSDEYKNRYSGFDCYYDASLAYQEGKFLEKKKNRFQKNKEGLTPYEEIEGHTFSVIKSLKYTPSKDGKDSRFLLFLNREDNKSLILAIPFQVGKQFNDLTLTMRYRSLSTNAICIPYITVNKLDSLKTNHSNVTYFRNSEISGTYRDRWGQTKDKIDEKKCVEYVAYASRLFGKELNKQITGYSHTAIVNDILFCNAQGVVYKQLAMKVSIKEETYFIPFENFIATGQSDFDYSYKFDKNYIKESVVYDKLISDISEPYRSLRRGDLIYYGLNGHFDSSMDVGELLDGYYTFDKYFARPTFAGYSMMASFIDNKGTRYNVKAGTNWKKSNSYGGPFDFVSAFYPQLQADSILEAKRMKAQEDSLLLVQQEKENAEFITMVTKKYGSQYASYYNDLGKYSKEKFRTATKKWGAKIAKDICEGVVRLGWDRDKCWMSWGDPLDINTSIGSWGRHEQWCYRSSYLYFENGKLTSIQN